MGNFFRRLGDRFRNFMIGRYGTDSFGMFLVYALLVIIVISMFFRGGIVGTVLNLLTWVIFIYSWFRILSRNYAKRSAENRWYLEKTAAITSISSAPSAGRSFAYREGRAISKSPAGSAVSSSKARPEMSCTAYTGKIRQGLNNGQTERHSSRALFF